MSLFDDGNKTELTKRITAAVYLWLDERGCKPVETEVLVAEGWIADVASAVAPTHTELQALRLIRPKPKTGRQGSAKWYAEAESLCQLYTVAVEVKISTSDYWRDFSPVSGSSPTQADPARKGGRVAPVDLRYIAVPRAICGLWKPDGWGLLVYDKDAESLRCSAAPSIAETTSEQKLSVIYEIACRRDNRGRYEQLRKMRNRIRDEENERKSLGRMTKAIRAALAIANGEHGSIDEVLEWYGLGKLPGYVREDAEKLWNIATGLRP